MATAAPARPPIEVKGGELRSWKISRDGSLMAIAIVRDGKPPWGEVQVWEVRGQRQRPVLSFRDDQDVAIDLSHDGRRLATASTRYGVRVWDLSLTNPTGRKVGGDTKANEL